MPVHTRKIGDKWRVVEKDGGIARTDTGAARDGGGHYSKKKAERQARAINEPKDD